MEIDNDIKQLDDFFQFAKQTIEDNKEKIGRIKTKDGDVYLLPKEVSELLSEEIGLVKIDLNKFFKGG